MDFYDVVNARRTVRDFDPVPIDDGTVRKILAAGMRAPSNDHLRDWHFIVIKDKDIVLKLIEIIPKRISEEGMQALIQNWKLHDPIQQACYRDAVPKQYRMLSEASCLVVPLFKQKTDIFKVDTLPHLNGFASIWCCIENIFLAATAEHYACTLRIPLGDEATWAREVLQYPKECCMPCLIAIGKPRADAALVKQKEFSLEERIHWNRW